jgi:cobalt-zinc-cadmium efflux system membrane fusion protein
MRKNSIVQNWSFAGSGRLLIPLALGLILGAFLYSRFSGTGTSRDAVVLQDQKQESATIAAGNESVQIDGASQKEVGILAEPVVRRNLQDNLSATGTVREDPGRVAHVRPLARGLIKEVYVHLGDRVSAGDPLLEYDNMELGLAIGEFMGAQVELQRSLADIEVKKKILERSREMLREGAIARTSFDLREAENKDAEAKAAGVRALVAKISGQIRRFGWTDQQLSALEANPQMLGSRMSQSVLKAPFSGVITGFHASIGEAVEPSTELLTITDMSSLWVLADVFEKDLSHIQPGKAVQVRVSSYPGKVFEGKITYVDDIIEPKTRTAKVRCLVQNQDRLLKLEMFATIEIPVDRINSVLAVRDSSIQQIDNDPIVFVKKSDTEFQKQKVQTGIVSGGYTEILSGLKGGELVVSQGSFVVKTAFLRDRIGEEE